MDTAPHAQHESQLRIVFTSHAKLRLCAHRQQGITADDVIAAANSIPYYCPRAIRFRNFKSKTGKPFSIVICDSGKTRVIITIIGG